MKTGPSFDTDWNGLIGNIDGVYFNNVFIQQNHANMKNQLVTYDSTSYIKNINFNSVYVGGELLTELSPSEWNLLADPGDSSTNYNDENEVTFSNDPVTKVNVIATQPSASKAGLTGGKLTFTRTTANNSQPVTVNYKIRGNAVSGKDYVPLSGRIVIPAGADSADVDVMPLAGNYRQGIEQVLVVLKTGDGYMIDKDFLATVNIYDNGEAPPKQTILFSDNFDAPPAGTNVNLLGGWTSVSDTGASSTIFGRADSANKVLSIANLNTGGNLQLDNFLS